MQCLLPLATLFFYISVFQRSINGEEVQLLLKTADGKLMQLSATPISELSNISNVGMKQQTVFIRTEPALRCVMNSEPKKSVISRLSLAKMVIYTYCSVNHVFVKIKRA